MRLTAISKIKAAPWNPKGRIAEKRLGKLLASIEDIGLVYPVVVDESMNLVDGHRRLACAKKLGWTMIPTISVTSEFLHAYGSVQANQEKLTGNDLIGVY